MPTEITFLGHSSFSIRVDDCTILIDPYLDNCPTATMKSDEVEADYMLLSHGHFDHVEDAVAIAHRTKATVISNIEICNWLTTKEVENTVQMNIGGGIKFPFGHVKMTNAVHSSSMPDGSYGGCAAGFLLTFKEGKVYFACDTALFLDMNLIGTAGLDLAFLPIGDCFTMGPDDAVEAVRLLKPRRVVPVHYDTWPAIKQDPHAWADRVKVHTAADPVVMQPGEVITLS